MFLSAFFFFFLILGKTSYAYSIKLAGRMGRPRQTTNTFIFLILQYPTNPIHMFLDDAYN